MPSSVALSAIDSSMSGVARPISSASCRVVGGSDGTPGAVRRNGETVFPKGKLTLQPGERLELELPGGGGWGNPLERPRELVENDLQQGLVSEAQARAVYGWKGR